MKALAYLSRAILSAIALAQIATPLWAQSSPSAYTSASRYDSLGRVTGTISPDPDGTGALHYAAVRNTYDDAGRLTKAETGELLAWQSEAVTPANWINFTVLQVRDIVYDADGRRVRESLSGSGQTKTVTQFSYDNLGRLACTAVRMDPAQWNSQIDTCVPQTTGPDGADRITKNVYDAAGQLTQTREGVGTSIEVAEVTYSYTPNGKKEYIIDAGGNRAQFTYDGLDRQISWIFPSPTRPTAYNDSTQATALSTAGSVNASDYEQYGYDAGSNRTSLRKRDSRTLKYTYDSLNRVTSKCATTTTCVAPNATTGRDVYYTYDLLGHQLSARFDGAAGSDGVTDGYNGFGNLASSTISMAGFSRTIGSFYDADGNRIQITHPDSQAFTYTFDGIDRQIGIAEFGSSAMIGLAYNAASRPNPLNRSNGRQTLYEYDSISRVSALTNTSYGSSADVRFDFTMSPASQIAIRSSSNDGYAFDGLVTVNRSYTANGLNQYAAAGPASFCYDGNGNLTADGTYVYKYDVENRLVEKRSQVSSNCPVSDYTGTLQASLTYDPLGRLWQVTSGSTNTRFLYDGDALIGEYDSSGNLVSRYVHGSDLRADDPLVDYVGATLGNRRFLETDQQGSVIYIASSAGATVATNRYDEYGIPSSTNAGRFQYTGQIWIPELGMYYYKARIYSPTLGRFLQVDPIGYADRNALYAYVGNDPVNRADPTGEVACALAEICVTGTRPCSSCHVGAPQPPALHPPSLPKLSLPSWKTWWNSPFFSACFQFFINCSEGDESGDDAEPSDGATPGRETKGPTKQYEKPGGIKEANDDFDKAKPENVSDKGNGIRVGTLPDGRTIVVRPRSSDGRPTVEVRRPNGRGYEVRYGPRT